MDEKKAKDRIHKAVEVFGKEVCDVFNKMQSTPSVESLSQNLVKFAKECIRQICWDQDYDGGSLQERAVELGIVRERPVTQKDIDEEAMVNHYDYEVGDMCYFFTEVYQDGDD